MDSGEYWYYIPAIGVPQSWDCYESVKMLERWIKTIPQKVFLIYDDLSVLPRWIEHLEWMNKYLDEIERIKNDPDPLLDKKCIGLYNTQSIASDTGNLESPVLTCQVFHPRLRGLLI